GNEVDGNDVDGNAAVGGAAAGSAGAGCAAGGGGGAPSAGVQPKPVAAGPVPLVPAWGPGYGSTSPPPNGGCTSYGDGAEPAPHGAGECGGPPNSGARGPVGR